MEDEEEQRLAGGSLTNHVRNRLGAPDIPSLSPMRFRSMLTAGLALVAEHELSELRLQHKGTLSQLHMVQDRLKRAEKDLHSARLESTEPANPQPPLQRAGGQSKLSLKLTDAEGQAGPGAGLRGLGRTSSAIGRQKASIEAEMDELRQSLAGR